MKLDLKGYNAIITGAASGMGYQMAKELLAHGATVVAASRPGAKLEAAVTELASGGGDVHAMALDVSDEESVMAAGSWFEGRFDHLDMLVNNAGIGSNAPGMAELPADHRFYDIPASTVRAVLDTNILGHFMVASRFVPIMVSQGRGRLVYTSTSDSTMTRPGQLPYGPSKAGAEAMTKIMAQELDGTGVTTNVICPGGFTDTGMAGAGVKEFFEKSGMPVLQPTVMNKAILFLASPTSDGVNGEKLIGKDFDQWLNERGIQF